MSARRIGLAVALCLVALSAWASMRPRAELNGPSDGQRFVTGQTVYVSGSAYSFNGEIVQMSARVDGVTIATVAGDSIDAPWIATLGTHTVYVTAKDVVNMSATSPSVTITVVQNQMPTVSLTGPANGSTYMAGTTVPITATASDADGTVRRVEFWVDEVMKAEDTTSPYAYNWLVPSGNHTLQVKAVDNANGTTTSASVGVFGNVPPWVNVTSPGTGSTYTVGATVPITADAGDSGGSVNRVEFRVDGGLVCTDSTSPYSCNWVATSGAHGVQARAVDNLGATKDSVAITVNGNPPPSVSLTSPANGASPLIGNYLTLSANASDAGGSVSHVEFLVDGAKVGQDYTSPYAYAWPVTAGNHTVQARAIDDLGVTTTTAAIGIFGNEPPTVALISPATGAFYAAGAPVPLTAIASDDDGSIARVEFWVDGAKVADDTSSPYAYDWTMTAGSHSLGVKAVDDRAAATNGATATIQSVPSGATALTRQYTYNAYQELCRVDEPETGATLMGYDAAGNLTWSASGLPAGTACDAEGDTAAILNRKATRSYDARNRVTLLAFADHESDTAYTYTPTGQLETIQASNGGDGLVTTSYTYNRRDMPTHEELVIAGTIDWPVGYVYDANGHLAKQGWHGLLIDYAPNALGQATQASDYATDVRYWPNGAIRQFTYGNGIVHTMTQNARGLPDVSKDAYGSTAIHQDEYAYDQVGNVLSITDAATGQNQKGNRDMAYDGLNRLTSVSAPDMFGIASYAYDVQDNLKHVQVTAGSQPRNVDYCYDAANRLTNVTLAAATYCGGATVTGLGYDVQGNLANKDGVLYAFDQGNRLRSVSGALGAYLYDGHGRRVQDTVGGAAKRSQYTLSGQLVMSGDDRAGKVREYISLGGSLVLIRERDIATDAYTMLYQHTDALGSPVAVTTETRALVERREYEPYGYQISPFALKDGPGYTGHVADAATGLVYMQQRYYDPVIGRFDSVDAVTALQGGPQHFNSYDYAYNNPYKFTDPDGRCPECIGAIAGAGLELLVQSAEIYAGTRTEYSGTDVAISAVAGATGVGAAKLIGRAKELGTLAKFAVSRVTDGAISAGTQAAKTGDVSASDVAIDVVAGAIVGDAAGGRAAEAAGKSATGKVLERQANRAERVAAGSNRAARQDAAASARAAQQGYVNGAAAQAGVVSSNAASSAVQVTCKVGGKEC